MAATAAGLGALGGVGGLYLSWHADVGAGPAIVLVLAGTFALVALVSRIVLRRVLIKAAVAGVALLALGAAGCADQGGDEAAGPSRLDVVATTMVLGDFARQVGGDRVRVTGLLGPDADPHEYEPTPSDADAVAGADLVVENGAGLDDWLGDLLDTAGADAPRVTAVEGIELLPSEEEGFAGDPHVWHDPAAARRMVDAIAAGLAAADPGGRATYTANAARYGRELERMARRIRERFAAIPAERRRLVTTHDAFGYFARAYDVEVAGSVLPSVTTETEPSARQVDALVRDLRRLGVRTIFTEEAVDPRLERQIAAEAGAEVSTSLYADVLAAEGPEATFVGAELANAEAMASAWEASP
jgi:ABC-type Zn uptake system ZnuABC Zn-binding protein ZnuA